LILFSFDTFSKPFFAINLQLALKYMESIKGTGVARANAGANDKASWS